MFAFNANTTNFHLSSRAHLPHIAIRPLLESTWTRLTHGPSRLFNRSFTWHSQTAPAPPRFVANLITNATSSPQTYVFAELLESPAVQALRAPETPDEFKGYLTLLEIFAWGTWEQYHGKILAPIWESSTDIR